MILPVVLYGCESWVHHIKGRTKAEGVSRIGCWGRYLVLRERRQQGSGENTHRGTLWSVLLTKYYSADEIKENEMGGECGTYGVEDKWVRTYGLSSGKGEGGSTFGRPCLQRSTILKWNLKIGWKGSVYLAQGRTCGGLLWKLWLILGFHKIGQFSWLPNIYIC